MRQLMHKQLSFSFLVGLMQYCGLCLKKTVKEACINFWQKLECNLRTDSVYTILGAVKTTFQTFLSCPLFSMTFGSLIFENCSWKERLLIRFML